MLTVRVASPADAAVVESIRIGTWRTAYRGIVPDAVLEALTVDVTRRAELIADVSSTTLLALSDDQPVGMAVFGPSRDDVEGLELYALYVCTEAWGTGAGHALLASCTGVTSLWVLEQNARARAFYERHGFVADGTSKELDLGGPVVEIRMLLV